MFCVLYCVACPLSNFLGLGFFNFVIVVQKILFSECVLQKKFYAPKSKTFLSTVRFQVTID